MSAVLAKIQFSSIICAATIYAGKVCFFMATGEPLHSSRRLDVKVTL